MPVWKKFEAPVLEEVTNYFYEIQSTSSNQLHGFIIPIMYSRTSIQGTPSGLKCPFYIGNRYKDYVAVFLGTKFVSPE